MAVVAASSSSIGFSGIIVEESRPGNLHSPVRSPPRSLREDLPTSFSE
ncbi:unnamed protein product [Spirodela intermedia]|uniref:Uncharacterized protein n=1 Tax=Spirodela intermedia TaxID=51605 RepID=A0A7I8ICL9_SPIIN|nr:unnamed protein product [Spirodela intermedia]CAA6655104.1 unnamed protein product [Spirodela intermedia]